MKKITPCLCLFIFLLIFFVSGKIYSQSVNINYILEELESITYVKVLTPLGNQPNSKKFTVTKHEWNAADLEKSKQYHLYNGGLFKQIIDNGVKYLEKTNYLEKTKSNCVAFLGNGLIYLGTDNGIAVSTNDGESWLKDTEDDINNLSDRKINFLKVISNVLYAGTDNGIFTSTDNGETWDDALDNKNVSCIEISPTGVIFVGTSTGSSMGVYKYENNVWVSTTLQIPTICLYVNGTTLYAGTANGLRMTTDNGSTWSNQLFEYSGVVTCIFIDGSNIFIGTVKHQN